MVAVVGPNGIAWDVHPVVASGLVGDGTRGYAYATVTAPAVTKPVVGDTDEAPEVTQEAKPKPAAKASKN